MTRIAHLAACFVGWLVAKLVPVRRLVAVVSTSVDRPASARKRANDLMPFVIKYMSTEKQMLLVRQLQDALDEPQRIREHGR